MLSLHALQTSMTSRHFMQRATGTGGASALPSSAPAAADDRSAPHSAVLAEHAKA